VLEIVVRDLISHFVTASPEEKRWFKHGAKPYPSPLEKVPKGDEVPSHRLKVSNLSHFK
jgi:hypothetical protein